MKVLGISILNELICSCALIVAYIAVLAKVYWGTHFQIVTKILIQLLVSNIGTVINTYASYFLFIKERRSFRNVLLLSIGESVQDSCFGVAHWIFAMQFYRIGTDMPLIVDGRPLSIQTIVSRKLISNIMLGLNIFFPVLTGIILVFFNIKVDKDNPPSAAIEFIAFFAPDVTGLLLTVSGVVLIIGVYKI